MAICIGESIPQWFRNARRATRERCADRCNACNDSGKVLGRERPRIAAGHNRDGALSALGGKISYACPRYCLARDIVAREEPQSASWASDKDLWKSMNTFTFTLHSFTFAVVDEKDIECEISCRNKHFHKVPGWRNWQTQRAQNPPRFTPRGGSTPPPGTSPKAQRISG